MFCKPVAHMLLVFLTQERLTDVPQKSNSELESRCLCHLDQSCLDNDAHHYYNTFFEMGKPQPLHQSDAYGLY
jgi:hypothetical protein